LVEKLRELFAAMTRQATADDFAVQDIGQRWKATWLSAASGWLSTHNP
jgi:hypothetical protein